MTVYVDDMLRAARIGNREDRWSHLFADTREELHVFAERLGLRRAWFQYADDPVRWHYDVPEAVRLEAIRLGARAIAYPSEVARILAARRHADRRGS